MISAPVLFFFKSRTFYQKMLVLVLLGDKNFSRVFDGKSSNGTLRAPVVLETLRSFRSDRESPTIIFDLVGERSNNFL